METTPPAETSAPAATDTPPERPAHVPVKFWDAQAGTLRVEALLKSYLELERKLSAPPLAEPLAEKQQAGASPSAPADAPERVEDYCIQCDHGLFEPDRAINERLLAAGYTPAQAQLLYDLAAERMLPLLREMAAGFEADREMEKLVAHFGGPEKWQDLSGQILAWARRNLPPPLVAALSGTADGVLALHRLMADGGGEPKVLRPGAGDAGGEGDDLNRMIADPRYWRDRDPAFIARVTDGFRQKYG
ncbi:capsid assembly protein [Niveispirillum fermenti]|uniref:capsid assembly protein n=1 Tax=Niveispirillum fermenti TaxID=1233113 RepID=UPI003A861332